MNQPNGFWKVVPNPAKIIAALSYAGFAVLIRFALLPTDADMRQWLEWQKDLFSVGIPLVLPLYILLVGYVYGDAKRRGMRHVMWTLIAALMPYVIGMIIYFVVRDPVLLNCPKCQTMAQRGFAFCPKCGAGLSNFCPRCGRTIESGWVHCAYCGVDLTAPPTERPTPPGT